MGENRGIWVFSEKHDLTLEILGKGRELADELHTELAAILVGSDVEKNAYELIKHGADKIYVVENPTLERFQIEPYANVLSALITSYKPEIILIGSTRNGKPLAAKLATRFETGCLPDCTKLTVDGNGRVVGERITYGGNAVARVALKTKPQIVTIPSRAFDKPQARDHHGQIIRTDMNIGPSRTEIVETKPLEASNVRIEEAEIIVSCGRGLQRKEDKAMLEELSTTLCGQVGCSRPLAEDRKWFSEWIGLSGHKVKPKLYVACGVSGVIQHVAGIRDSKVIVAINKDPEAPIFEVADYGVVGDLYQILPALKEALKKHLNRDYKP